MSPLELADILDDCSPWVATNEGWEAAATLRVQHDLIVKLRETLALALDDLPDYVYSLEPVLDVLEATKEYDNNHT